MTWYAASRVWRSGPWSLSLRGDELADIAFDGHLVLRGIRAVVRDREWDTASLVVDGVEESDATLTLAVHSAGLGSSFSGSVGVRASASTLVVALDLHTAAPFATNRTGLVLLHPPGLAGSPLDVDHAGGGSERTAFPADISPHQPVMDIASLSWTTGGMRATVRFAGDVFEMEDQRNWTDASFKTYSRPLSLPFPYHLDAGERVRQKITLEVAPATEGAAETASARRDISRPARATDVIDLRPGGAFPQILVGAATAPDPAPEIDPLGAGVLVELDVASPAWRAALARAGSTGRPLDVRLVLDPADIAAVHDAVAALRELPVLRIGAFARDGDAPHVSDAEVTGILRDALAAAGCDSPVIGGARSHFTELNRERHRLAAGLDGIAVTVTPLFHATGTEQLVESVAMQRIVARQTVAQAQGAPVHVGPVTLRPRFNNVAAGAQPGPVRADLSGGYGAEFTGLADERQAAPELAAWTIASAAALAVPGVASLAWFEEWGPRGIHAADGRPLPVADAVRALAAATGGELWWGDSPDGLRWAVGSLRDGALTVLCANLDRRAQTLTVTARDASTTVTLPPGEFAATAIPMSAPTPGPARAPGGR
ncbi:hypothetical protein LJR045_002640 [Microbacterium sp. LjRoot45]|uniref:hypothetical protein n=1 Tax=Microbacterium sp. LjRoot45 TaxID=3342329 RepID=UPI003ECDAE72